MKNLCAAIVAVSLLTTTAMAAAPLAPGKPAGLDKAQDQGGNTVLYIIGVGALAAGIALIASGSNDNDNAIVTPPTTNTTKSSTSST